MECPECGRPMQTERRDRILLQVCSSCSVGATTLVSLKHWLSRERWNALRRTVVAKLNGRAAVVVEHEGRRHRFIPASQVVLTDLAFFDDAQPEHDLSPEARHSVAAAQTAILKDRGRDTPFDRPREDWKWWSSWAGVVLGGALSIFPFEDGAKQLRRPPWTTWTLALAMGVVFWIGTGHDLSGWAFVPADPWRHLGLTALTSFLLHDDWFHLVVNVYFLVVFCNNAEDALPWWKFLLLLAAGEAAANAAHATWDPRAGMPLIGASGGISAALAFTVLTYPRRRIGILWIPMVTILWVRMSMWLAFAIWMLGQALRVDAQLEGRSAVSYLGHLGGVAAGIAIWLLWRPRRRA